MTWRNVVLRLLARGLRTPAGEELDSRVVERTLDRISGDAELSARFDELEEEELRAEFLALYEAERSRDA